MLGLDFDEFFLGAQVDRAQTLALAAQPLERGLDLGDVGQGFAFGKFGERRDR